MKPIDRSESHSLLRDRRGGSFFEYVILTALAALLCIGVLRVFNKGASLVARALPGSAVVSSTQEVR